METRAGLGQKIGPGILSLVRPTRYWWKDNEAYEWKQTFLWHRLYTVLLVYMYLSNKFKPTPSSQSHYSIQYLLRGTQKAAWSSEPPEQWTTYDGILKIGQWGKEVRHDHWWILKWINDRFSNIFIDYVLTTSINSTATHNTSSNMATFKKWRDILNWMETCPQ